MSYKGKHSTVQSYQPALWEIWFDWKIYLMRFQRKKKITERLAQYEHEMAASKEEYEKPFQFEEELKEKLARQSGLNAQLELDNTKNEVLESELDHMPSQVSEEIVYGKERRLPKDFPEHTVPTRAGRTR